MRKYILALAAVAVALHCNAGTSGAVLDRTAQFCDALCNCEDCTDADRDVCIENKGDLGSEAEAAHCEDDLDTYYDCLEKDAFCDNSTYDTSACRVEENQLSTCINGASGSGGSGGGGPCPYTNNGTCDEPQGTGLCPAGTDVADCGAPPCPYTNNGTCDEPQGTGLCAAGTDVADCGTSCVTCSQTFAGSSSMVCAASQTIYTTLLTCACPVLCTNECANYCTGNPDTSTCFNCMQTYCPAEYMSCSNDL